MAYIPPVVCLRCRIPFRPLKNDVTAEAYVGDDPYYKVRCDAWQCPRCGVKILIGFGNAPFTEAYMPNYNSGSRSFRSSVSFQLNWEHHDPPQDGKEIAGDLPEMQGTRET